MSMTEARRRLAARATRCEPKLSTPSVPKKLKKLPKHTERQRAEVTTITAAQFDAMPTITPAQIIRAPRITRMDTLVACRTVLRRILKAMAKGEIPSQLGARMSYTANLIAAIVKLESELKELTALREQLAALRGRGHVALLEHGDASGDYIPAAVHPEEPS
jgi:predicted component of type VI protein secretion system